MTNETMTKLIKFDVTEAAIAELRERYADPPEIVDGKTFKAIKSGISTIRTLRTNVEKRRKELKADPLALCRAIDSKAGEIKTDLLAIEEPMKARKEAYEAKLEQARQEKARIERERVEKIQAKIRGMIARDMTGIDSAGIQAEIDRLKAIVISEDEYQEFTDSALETWKQSLATLKTALDVRVRWEKEQEEARIERERLDKERKEFEARQREADRLEKERQEKIRREEKERQDKIDAENRKLEKERREIEAEKRRIQQAEDEKKREAEAARLKKIEEERRAKQLEAEKPDREKLESFRGKIQAIELPEMETDNGKAALEIIAGLLSDVADVVARFVG